MIQALTPGQFTAATNVLSVLAIMIGLPLIVCGTAGIVEWWRDGRKSVTDRVRAALPEGRCDWCDGFTNNPRRCTCTGEKCTFVPLCQPLKGPQ